MLRKILNKFTSVIYVQIWENRIRVVNIKTGCTFDEKPFVLIQQNAKGQKLIKAIGNNAEYATSSNEESINPFSHPRFLLNNFFVAEKLLQHAVHELLGKFSIKPSPSIVMHPMEKIEGGLSQIEERAYTELALGAGAYDVVVHTGDTLPNNDVNFETLKVENNECASNEPVSNDFVSNKSTTENLCVVVCLVLAIGAFLYFYGSP